MTPLGCQVPERRTTGWSERTRGCGLATLERSENQNHAKRLRDGVATYLPAVGKWLHPAGLHLPLILRPKSSTVMIENHFHPAV